MTTEAPIEVWVTAPAGGTGTGGTGGFDDRGEVETHSRFGDAWRALREVKADPEEFLASWHSAYRSIQAVFAADEQAVPESAFQLQSVTAKLTLKASGKVLFVGEAGGEVTFEACFARRPPDAHSPLPAGGRGE
jgi:hypothetical protein